MTDRELLKNIRGYAKERYYDTSCVSLIYIHEMIDKHLLKYRDIVDEVMGKVLNEAMDADGGEKCQTENH